MNSDGCVLSLMVGLADVDVFSYRGGEMGQEYARTGRNTIIQVHSQRPQPVTKMTSYKLEGIGSKRGVAFITPRSNR
jgi:hypothetical protein